MGGFALCGSFHSEGLRIIQNRVQFEAEHDTDFAYELPGLARFRCNLFKQERGMGAVFRIIPTKIMTIEQLGLPPITKALCDHPKGLVVVTGPELLAWRGFRRGLATEAVGVVRGELVEGESTNSGQRIAQGEDPAAVLAGLGIPLERPSAPRSASPPST